MKYSCIIWDWNGTLFEDMLACIEAMNKLLSQKGLKCISGIDEYRSNIEPLHLVSEAFILQTLKAVYL